MGPTGALFYTTTARLNHQRSPEAIILIHFNLFSPESRWCPGTKQPPGLLLTLLLVPGYWNPHKMLEYGNTRNYVHEFLSLIEILTEDREQKTNQTTII